MAVSRTAAGTINDGCNSAIAACSAGIRKADVLRHGFEVIAFSASGCSFKMPSSQESENR